MQGINLFIFLIFNAVIYQILYVKESGNAIALTAKGLMVFETLKIKFDIRRPSLVPSKTCCVDPALVCGVIVPKLNCNIEVWCCSTSDQLKVFDVSNIGTVIDVLRISKAEHHLVSVNSLKHVLHFNELLFYCLQLQYFEVNNQRKVAVSMGNLLQILDAETRKQEGFSFDTHTSCCTLYGPNG